MVSLRCIFIVLCLVCTVFSYVIPSAEACDSVVPGSVFNGKAILNMRKAGNLCALTFDDGPGPHTGKLLDLLKEKGIKATFFVVGQQVKMRPQLIRRMIEEGHEVENHTFSHGNLRHMPSEQQKKEIGCVQRMLKDLGATPRLVRPPYGRYDETTVETAREEGLALMFWSVDSMDWMHGASIENMRTLIRGQKLRGIFLFHDTHAQTVDAMPEILDWLSADGCRFVTVAEFLQEAGGQNTESEKGVTDSPAGSSSEMPGGRIAGEADTGVPVDRGSAGNTKEDDAVFSPPRGLPPESRKLQEGDPKIPLPGDTLREYRHPLVKEETDKRKVVSLPE